MGKPESYNPYSREIPDFVTGYERIKAEYKAGLEAGDVKRVEIAMEHMRTYLVELEEDLTPEKL
ncbi:MAG: hypothetical protein KW793_01260 [Candidatus Doudnabacteria bacterium]|nr:hypothetical protein [Candidatus Doudnabacteria bacterium]